MLKLLDLLKKQLTFFIFISFFEHRVVREPSLLAGYFFCTALTRIDAAHNYLDPAVGKKECRFLHQQTVHHLV
jgi:hypothetical protein